MLATFVLICVKIRIKTLAGQSCSFCFCLELQAKGEEKGEAKEAKENKKI
jgi:hypothetical protein